jgi:hypothetical protein
MRTIFRSAMAAALLIAVAAPAMPARAVTHAKAQLHAKAQQKTASQGTHQITVNDAATGEGEGVASGAPTGFSGQVATGNLARDAARDNNPSNGTAINTDPASP